MVATLAAAVVGWWWEAISRFTFACLVVFIRAFPPLHVFACLLVFVHAFLFKSFSCFNKKKNLLDTQIHKVIILNSFWDWSECSSSHTIWWWSKIFNYLSLHAVSQLWVYTCVDILYNCYEGDFFASRMADSSNANNNNNGQVLKSAKMLLLLIIVIVDSFGIGSFQRWCRSDPFLFLLISSTMNTQKFKCYCQPSTGGNTPAAPAVPEEPAVDPDKVRVYCLIQVAHMSWTSLRQCDTVYMRRLHIHKCKSQLEVRNMYHSACHGDIPSGRNFFGGRSQSLSAT